MDLKQLKRELDAKYHQDIDSTLLPIFNELKEIKENTEQSKKQIVFKNNSQAFWYGFASFGFIGLCILLSVLAYLLITKI